ncbi:protein kinase domain-containing protein [Streptomyces xiamenensis]
MQGRVLDDRYQIGPLLGAGGMGTVWEALDMRLERQVAIKVVNTSAVGRDPQAGQRFAREAKLLAGLSSPYIVTVHDVGEAEFDGSTVLYLVMERLPGRSLDQVLAEEIPPLGEVARWGEKICRALAVAHDAGVVHRDLKPGNVMVESDGLARVLDFGIAAVLAESTDHARLTSTGVVIGTPAYMSPEQVEGGTVDARSDLYAFGCVLYALATGRPPFHGASLYQLLRQQMESDPPPPSELRPELPAEWDELIMTLLAKDPDDRPDSASEVAERLRELAILAVDLPAEPVEEALAYQPTRVDPRAVLLSSCPRPGGGRLPLATGQRLLLDDVLPGAETFIIGLDWQDPEDMEPEDAPEVDASALILDEDGQVLSDGHFIFYNNLDPGDESVQLAAEEPGEGEEEGTREARITVRLPELDERAVTVRFALSVHDAEARGHDLSHARALHIRLLDPAGDTELLCYGFPVGPVHCTGLTLGELTLGEDGWGFHAISRGYAGGLGEIAETHGVNVRGGTDGGEDGEAEDSDEDAESLQEA